MDEDENKLKITCQHFNGFVICKGRSGELLYIDFLHAVIYTLGLYYEKLVPEIFYFQWPARTKIQRFYQNILK